MTKMIPTKINGRWTLKLPEHRHDRPQWPWWEATRLAAMHHFISKMWFTGKIPVVFDIGAEEGDFPALYAQWGAKVVMVEPNPKVWPNIKAIFEANTLKPLATVQALASNEKVNDPTWQEDWPTCAYGEVIGDHGFINLAEAGDTPQVRVDDITQDIITPDVITIDTEGSELRVLEGAWETLSEHRPIVFVSVHEQFMKDMYPGDTPQALDDYMETLSYHKTYLGSDHEDHIMYHPDRSFH